MNLIKNSSLHCLDQNKNKNVRICSVTGEKMNEGYCILDGEMYIKNHFDMLQHIVDETDYKSIREAYIDEYYYWTQWEE